MVETQLAITLVQLFSDARSVKFNTQKLIGKLIDEYTADKTLKDLTYDLQCDDGWGGNGEYCALDPDLDYVPDFQAVYCSEFTCKHVRI